MIIWKGVNVFPMQIEQILMHISDMIESYLVTLETERGVDKMTVQVEVNSGLLVGDKSQALTKRISDALQSELLVRPEVQVVPSGTIPATETKKARRVVDKRLV